MKTTNNIPRLQDWQQNLKSPNKNFEKTISGDDLNYLANKGFEKGNITDADLNDVFNKINAKTKPTFNFNALFIGGIVAIVFVSAYFVLTNKNKTVTIKEENKKPIVENLIVENKSPVVDSINTKENVAAPYQKEHFAIKNIEQPYQTNNNQISNQEIVDMNVNQIAALNVENSTEINVAQLPNAPFIYIKGLKITNYHVYYFKNNQPFELVNGGLGAEFEEVSAFKNIKSENKTENKLTADVLLREAVESFSDQNYAACIADFEILLKINKTDVNALFYSGMSFYFLNKKEKAIEFFNDVLENKNNIFHQEAEFYKALALVDIDNNLEASQLLKKIIEAKGFYAQRAKELLKTLK